MSVRLLRPIADDLVYHAINRGDDRSTVSSDPTDHLAFLEALARTRSRYPLDLDGYGLMTNHSHLLLGPAPGSRSAASSSR